MRLVFAISGNAYSPRLLDWFRRTTAQQAHADRIDSLYSSLLIASVILYLFKTKAVLLNHGFI
jgi:hypothetical protein